MAGFRGGSNKGPSNGAGLGYSSPSKTSYPSAPINPFASNNNRTPSPQSPQSPQQVSRPTPAPAAPSRPPQQPTYAANRSAGLSAPSYPAPQMPGTNRSSNVPAPAPQAPAYRGMPGGGAKLSAYYGSAPTGAPARSGGAAPTALSAAYSGKRGTLTPQDRAIQEARLSDQQVFERMSGLSGTGLGRVKDKFAQDYKANPSNAVAGARLYIKNAENRYGDQFDGVPERTDATAGKQPTSTIDNALNTSPWNFVVNTVADQGKRGLPMLPKWQQQLMPRVSPNVDVKNMDPSSGERMAALLTSPKAPSSLSQYGRENPILVSGSRNPEQQQLAISNVSGVPLDKMSQKLIANGVPGRAAGKFRSNHRSGQAVDFNVFGDRSYGIPAETALSPTERQFISENAKEFGFAPLRGNDIRSVKGRDPGHYGSTKAASRPLTDYAYSPVGNFNQPTPVAKGPELSRNRYAGLPTPTIPTQVASAAKSPATVQTRYGIRAAPVATTTAKPVDRAKAYAAQLTAKYGTASPIGVSAAPDYVRNPLTPVAYRAPATSAAPDYMRTPATLRQAAQTMVAGRPDMPVGRFPRQAQTTVAGRPTVSPGAFPAAAPSRQAAGTYFAPAPAPRASAGPVDPQGQYAQYRTPGPPANTYPAARLPSAQQQMAAIPAPVPAPVEASRPRVAGRPDVPVGAFPAAPPSPPATIQTRYGVRPGPGAAYPLSSVRPSYPGSNEPPPEAPAPTIQTRYGARPAPVTLRSPAGTYFPEAATPDSLRFAANAPSDAFDALWAGQDGAPAAPDPYGNGYMPSNLRQGGGLYDPAPLPEDDTAPAPVPYDGMLQAPTAPTQQEIEANLQAYPKGSGNELGKLLPSVNSLAEMDRQARDYVASAYQARDWDPFASNANRSQFQQAANDTNGRPPGLTDAEWAEMLRKRSSTDPSKFGPFGIVKYTPV